MDDTWMKLGSALLVLAMIGMIFPAAMKGFKEGNKGSRQEWMGIVLPIGGVVVFIILLVMMVR